MKCSYAVAVAFDLVIEQDAALMHNFWNRFEAFVVDLDFSYFFTEFLVLFCNLELNLVMARVYVMGLLFLDQFLDEFVFFLFSFTLWKA